MCGRGYKTAEHLAPFVIASLAALSVLLIRRYRISIPIAIAIVALYVSVVWPAYSSWIHGPNAPDFPNATSATRVLEDLKIIEAQESEPKALPNENIPGK